MKELVANLGARIDTVVGFKHEPDFAQRGEAAWRTVRDAIDDEAPCYGWELAMPEYYVIHGYDDTGYLFRDLASETGEGHTAWRQLGDSGIGVLEVNAVRPGTPADDRTTVRDAIRFAVDFASGSGEWTFDGYQAGLDAYDLWIDALRDGRADGFGTAYNAQVWAESRRHAARFLRDARIRLREFADPIGEAVFAYETVEERMKLVAGTFPFLDTPDQQKGAHVRDTGRVAAGVAALAAARDAEREGLRVLRRLADTL
jgi:hypothetical protein